MPNCKKCSAYLCEHVKGDLLALHDQNSKLQTIINQNEFNYKTANARYLQEARERITLKEKIERASLIQRLQYLFFRTL